MAFFKSRLLVILASAVLLSCNTIDCQKCDVKLPYSWTYHVKNGSDSYNEIEKANDHLYFQDRNRNTIVQINTLNGTATDLITYNSLGAKKVLEGEEGNQGYDISLSIDKNLMIYENIQDLHHSNLMIFDLNRKVLQDSIQLYSKQSLSSFKSEIKLSFKPVIIDSLILYGLNNGTIHCYNSLAKREMWKRDLKGALVINQPIITGNILIISAFKETLLTSGTLVLSLSLLDGHLLWSKYVKNLRLPISEIKNQLVGISDKGQILSIDKKNRELKYFKTLTNEPIAIFGLSKSGKIIVSDRNKGLFIYDYPNNDILRKYVTCDLIYKAGFVGENKMFIQDESGQLYFINLNNWEARCLSDRINTFSKFSIDNNYLYINMKESISRINIDIVNKIIGRN